MVDRFFLPGGFEPRRGEVELDEAEREHALHARRVRVGQAVELLDGEGTVARGRVAEATRRACVVSVEEVELREREGREVHLAISVPRGPRMDGVVDAATQMGVVAIRPVVLDRSVAGREDLSPSRLDRWRRIAQEAAKQSGEPFIPKIEAPVTLEALLAEEFDGLRIVLHPDPAATPLIVGLRDRAGAVRILAGPEGGFTAEELAKAKGAGERPASLGRSILRIEVAALAAAALARYGGATEWEIAAG